MNIATQGGKIILKDGQLAEDCACCGGWYCCTLEACAIASAVTVTVDTACGGDLVGTSKQFTPWGTGDTLYGGATGPGYYRYRQTIVPVSAFKGTHQLTRQPEDPLNPSLAVFSKNVTDAAGGTISMRVEIGVSSRGGGAIVLFITFPNHGWAKNTLDDSLGFKTTSQMPNATVCAEAEHSPTPSRGDWECYYLDTYGTSAGWAFGCQLAGSQFSSAEEIRSRQTSLFSSGSSGLVFQTAWSCSFDCMLTVQVQ